MALLPLAALLLSVLPRPVRAETVRFRTDDGVEIVADYTKGEKGAASVVCIPMDRSTRAAYRPLVLPLREKGFHVLAIDSRGRKESRPRLAPGGVGADAALLNAMHLDVEAAIRFLERQKGCDATRIGLIGAGVGCSVAVDTAVRDPNAVRVVVLLTPCSKDLGVLALKHLERWPGTRIFTLTSSEEESRSRGVMDELKPFGGSNHLVIPGKDIHGTRMFGKVPSIEELIANFMESALAGSADLRVPQWASGSDAPTQAGFFRRTLRPRRTVDGRTYSFMLFCVGKTWTLGGLVDQPFKGKLRFSVGKRRIDFVFDTAAPSGEIKSGSIKGMQATARNISWITFDLEQLEAGVRLALEFHPSKGKIVRLPAQGVFAARLQPVRDG